MTKKINVLIAEDSKVVTQLLRAIMLETDDINVIACASNGREAIKLTKQYKPDLITMDIEMPELDGLAAIKEIMSICPTPIVVITSHANSNTMNTAFNALRAGALTVIEKPHDVLSVGFQKQKRSLLTTLRALSEVHVIRRRFHDAPVIPLVSSFEKDINVKNAQIVALGVSTGGPEALYYILSQLPETFPLPIVIVQHIVDGFLPGLVNWLQRKSALKLHIIKENNQPLLAGNIYFAPDDYHLVIHKGSSGPVSFLEKSPAIDFFRPSITRLFSSLSESYPAQSIAGLLTGMGKDGASGLLKLKESGSHTFIQDESSCVVFGMPGAAKKINAECAIVELAKISEHLKQITKKGE